MARRYSEFAQFVFYSIVGAVIFLLIYSLWFNTGSVERTFENIKEAVSNQITAVQANNSLEEAGIVAKCRSQYNEYSGIGEQKYDVDYSLIEIKKIQSEQEAAEFWGLYSFMGSNFEMSKMIYGWEFNVFPIVMIAAKVRGSEGTLPIVLICDHNGDILEESKKQLTI